MNTEKVNTLVIHTPEGCSFSLLLAGPITRFLAWLVDLICVLIAAVAAWQLLGPLLAGAGGLAGAAAILTGFVIWVGYGIILEWFWRGRTIGKRLLNLRVVDEQGLRMTFGQIFIRNVLRLVDMLPALYLVGGAACVLTRRAQRLGDLAANTVVVRTPRIVQPDLARILGDKYNSFREHPHLEARLRQRIGPPEARIALLALLRRDELDPPARVELFADIAGHFASVVEFPPGATEGLSDEQYVRNIVDTLFRSRVSA